MSLTVAYCTSRIRPCIEWFIDSLNRQIRPGEEFPPIIIVDLHYGTPGRHPLCVLPTSVTHYPPKPTVWQGKDRLPKDNWWAASNSRNTALCLCKTNYILWVDDRCVLSETWLAAAREAEAGRYAVCGSYEKRHGMVVHHGIITDPGTFNSTDCRNEQSKGQKVKAPGQWFFGGTLGMTLDMGLTINGFEELMDGLSAEDCMAGLHLENNGFPIFHDPRLKIIEDRTPEELGEAMKRSSKERWPKDTEDKGHSAFRKFGRLRKTSHQWHLKDIRASVLAGNPFPGHNGEPRMDWHDRQPIAEMV